MRSLVVWWLVFGLGGAWATPGGGGAQGVGGEEVVAVDGEDAEGRVSVWEPVPDAHRKAYFDKKPDGFLVDPQRLLSPMVKRDRAAFLEYHAGDSAIDLHVYLLGGKQEVEAAECEDVMGRFFSGGKPSAVVWYPFGDPERAVMYLSPGLRGRVSEAESKRALASSVMQAVEKADPAGQLEAFLVQMSIRLYWVERTIGKDAAVAQVQGDMEKEAIASPKKEDPKDRLAEKLEPIRLIAREWAMEAGIVGAALLLLVLLVVFLRLRFRRVLPDFSVEPRLGGEHGAGVGAVISFASASVPPALQRGGIE